MQVPREMVLQRIRSEADADAARRAEDELPEKVDTDADAELLRRLGVDVASLEDAFRGQSPSAT